MSDRITVLIIGYGFSGRALARAAHKAGYRVLATCRNAETHDEIGKNGFEPVRLNTDSDLALKQASQSADFILSTAPPLEKSDPVLDLLDPGPDTWLGYLSTTGVYGDRQGGWIFEWDEPAPQQPRSITRLEIEKRWHARGAVVFRCGGIYGPGRSAIDRLQTGNAQIIDKPGHVFSRIHVDDLASGVLAAMRHPDKSGPFNLVDDYPSSQIPVYDEAARLLDMAPPDPVPEDSPDLSAMLKSFYAENRRVSNARAKAMLGWRPNYPTYREGLAACLGFQNN